CILWRLRWLRIFCLTLTAETSRRRSLCFWLDRWLVSFLRDCVGHSLNGEASGTQGRCERNYGCHYTRLSSPGVVAQHRQRAQYQYKNDSRCEEPRELSPRIESCFPKSPDDRD